MYYYNLTPRYSVPIKGKLVHGKTGSRYTYDKSKYARYVAQHFNVPTSYVLQNWNTYENTLRQMEQNNEPLQVVYLYNNAANPFATVSSAITNAANWIRENMKTDPTTRETRQPLPTETTTSVPTTSAPTLSNPVLPQSHTVTGRFRYKQWDHPPYNHIEDDENMQDANDHFTPEGYAFSHYLLGLNYWGPGPSSIINSEEAVINRAKQNPDSLAIQIDTAAYYHDVGVMQASKLAEAGLTNEAQQAIQDNDALFIDRVIHLYNNRHAFQDGNSFKVELMRYLSPAVNTPLGQWWQQSYFNKKRKRQENEGYGLRKRKADTALDAEHAKKKYMYSQNLGKRKYDEYLKSLMNTPRRIKSRYT